MPGHPWASMADDLACACASLRLAHGKALVAILVMLEVHNGLLAIGMDELACACVSMWSACSSDAYGSSCQGTRESCTKSRCCALNTWWLLFDAESGHWLT